MSETSLLTVGVFATSQKENERRVPIHPGQLEWIEEPVRQRLVFEEGYGVRFGISNAELDGLTGGVAKRDALFDQCDVALLAKPVQADFAQMKEGTVHWGWPHCVQQRDVTQTAIDRKLTLIAWEAMHRWSGRGLNALHRQPMGPQAPERVFDVAASERLVALAHQSPRDFDQPRSTWTLSLLAEVAFAEGLTPREVSGETVRQALVSLGHSWQRAKKWIRSPDAQYDIKKGNATV